MIKAERAKRKRAAPPKIVAPLGHFDAVGARISGWAFDPHLSPADNEFALIIDGADFKAKPTIPRWDVVRAGCATHPQVGFSLSLREILGHHATAVRDAKIPRSIRLVVGDRVVAESEWPSVDGVTGTLSSFDGNAIAGCITIPDGENFDVEVELLIDGIHLSYVATTAEQPGSSKRRFRLPLSAAPTARGEFRIEARVALSGMWLQNSPLVVEAPHNRQPRLSGQQLIMGDSPPEVSIVVPVFNAPEDLDRCLQSLVVNTTRPARLIVVDDASTAVATKRILQQAAAIQNVTVLRNPGNRGFSETVNRGISASGEDDVVILNSDTIVTPRWLEHLRALAYSHPATGTVTPLSNNAGMFSAPDIDLSNSLPPGVKEDEAGRLISQNSFGLAPEVPTGNGFCMYIKRACLDDVGEFDSRTFTNGYGEENDFCLRALRRGWRHVVDDRTYIMHSRSASFGAQERARLSELARTKLEARYPEYPALVRAFSASSDMMLSRYSVRRALASVNLRRPRPRVLTVIATDTGGTPQTNRDLATALEPDFEVFIARSDGFNLFLSQVRDGSVVDLATKVIETPITLAKHFASAYDNAIAEWLHELDIELVHIRHIAWHGLGLPSVCQQLEIPVVFSFHDFYTICPTVKLLDEKQRFCAGTCTPGPGPCVAELWDAADVPPLKHQFVDVWRAQTGAMFESVDAFVTTSNAAKDIICRNFPGLTESKFRVIPHGRDFAVFAQAASAPKTSKKIKLLAPGNLSVAKGANVLLDLASSDDAGLLEIHTMGDVAGVLKGAPIIHHGPYDREKFVELAKEIGPSLGLILSIWPETYCHTLTELWAAGIPVVAFDQGAVAERLREAGGGILVSDLTAAAVRTAVAALAADGRTYRRLVGEVRRWQRKIAPKFNIEEMARAYSTLYREALTDRRPFK